MNNDKKPLPGDNPIRDSSDDVLERADVAKSFAHRVLELDASEGVTVGIFGPWGSGKTSFLNLARAEFKQKRIPVVDFNPWMFSGTEQLVERFFVELSTELKLRNFTPPAKDLENYGEALSGVGSVVSSVVGAQIWGVLLKIGSIIVQIWSIIVQKRIADPHEKVRKALVEHGKPIIVALDDVDRLSVKEIRDIFKLVRLTAGFPNLIYIVVCDRLRVEKALGEDGLSGRDYLEKIIQLPFDLPEPPSHLLEEQIFQALEDASANITNPGPFDRQAWHDIYDEIVRPLIRTMRDVRRYAAAVRGTVADLEGRVEQVDVCALEAVRMFLPDVFRRLPDVIDDLTTTTAPRRTERHLETRFHSRNLKQEEWLEGKPEEDRRKARMDELVEADKTGEHVARYMIRRLFPVGEEHLSGNSNADYGSEWAKEKLRTSRVAHEFVLRFYLEREVGKDLQAFYDAEQALELMADRGALDCFMRGLDPSRWLDTLWQLRETLDDRFRAEHVEPGVIVFMNLLPDMPEPPLEGLDEPREITRFVASDLLSAVGDSAAAEDKVRRILPELTSLSSKAELIRLIGHQPNYGKRLVSETAAAAFEAALLDEIRSSSDDKLAEERHPVRSVLRFAKIAAGPSSERVRVGDSPRLTFNLLWDSRSATIISEIGTRSKKQIPKLYWDDLIDLYGDETTLKDRIESLQEQFESLGPWIKGRGISIEDAKKTLELAGTERAAARVGTAPPGS